ncbi:MAG: TldD family protein, Actinobacterial subgroup, partial [uncultured Gemmatimonadaceae bacterium]
ANPTRLPQARRPRARRGRRRPAPRPVPAGARAVGVHRARGAARRRGHQGAHDDRAHRRPRRRRLVRRRARRAAAAELRLHARAADPERRRHRLPRLRRPGARRRHLGLRRHPRPHRRRRRRRRAGGGGDREGEPRGPRPAGGAAPGARLQGCRLEGRLHARPLRRVGRGEGRPAAPRQRRGAQGARRQVRLQRAVLRQGGAQLRQHRRLGDRADERALVAHDADHRRRARLLRLPEPQQRRGADGARLGVRARARPRRQRAALGRRGRREAQGQARGRRPLRPRARAVAPVAHHPRVDRAPHGARPRDGLRGQLRGHELRRAPREAPRQAAVRPRLHERAGRPLAAGRALHDRLRRRGGEARHLPHHQERRAQRLPDHPRAGPVARLVVQAAGHRAALARVLLRPELGQRAVPAHAQRLAPPRREGPQAGRPRRRHRPRHPHRGRRLLLHRPAALQRAVRRPGLLRDQGRQDGRHAEGRRLPDAHAGLLERHGHDRRPVELRDGRLLLRRQGPARASQRREPRLRPRPLPRRERDQHREEGV